MTVSSSLSRLKVGPATAGFLLLAVFYSVELYGNGWSALVDDEIAMIASAEAHTAGLLAGAPQMHAHPPLHSLLLWSWMKVTDASIPLIRISSITFYVLGIMLCALAARQWEGDRGFWVACVVGVLWPLGIQLGPLQAWYGLSFFFAAGLTWALAASIKRGTAGATLTAAVFALGLAYTTYLGWAMVGLLSVLVLFFVPRQAGLAHWGVYVLAGLALAIVPLIPHFAQTLLTPQSHTGGPGETLAYLGYNAYALFAGESVAPWFFPLSIPLVAALVVVVGETFRRCAGLPQYLFLSVFLILVLMAFSGILATKRIFTLGPWVIVPVALALCRRQTAKPALELSASLVGGLALLGLVSGSFMAAPRFAEPWHKVAADQAKAARSGALLLAANPSFCFHMTSELRRMGGHAAWQFVGVAPWDLSHPQLMDPHQWEKAGRPLRTQINLVIGGGNTKLRAATQRAQQWLDNHCRTLDVQKYMRDSGFAWKNRIFPNQGQREWRIEVRSYQCDGATLASPLNHKPSGS